MPGVMAILNIDVKSWKAKQHMAKTRFWEPDDIKKEGGKKLTHSIYRSVIAARDLAQLFRGPEPSREKPISIVQHIMLSQGQ